MTLRDIMNKKSLTYAIGSKERSQAAMQLIALSLALSLSACSKDVPIRLPSAETKGEASAPGLSYKSVESLDSIAADTEALPLPSEPIHEEPTVEAPVAAPEASEGTEPLTLPANNGGSIVETPVVETNPELVVLANGKYLIQGVGSKKCLDVPDGKSDKDLQLQIWDCNKSSPNQTFSIEFVEQNYYHIITANKMSLEGKKDSLIPGSPLQQNVTTAFTNQHFSFEKSASSASYLIKLRGLDLVIDVPASQTGNGVRIQYAPTKSQPNQEWILIKVN
jgi:hypothetical protein